MEIGYHGVGQDAVQPVAGRSCPCPELLHHQCEARYVPNVGVPASPKPELRALQRPGAVTEPVQYFLSFSAEWCSRHGIDHVQPFGIEYTPGNGGVDQPGGFVISLLRNQNALQDQQGGAFVVDGNGARAEKLTEAGLTAGPIGSRG